jgi:hypothetical protein
MNSLLRKLWRPHLHVSLTAMHHTWVCPCLGSDPTLMAHCATQAPMWTPRILLLPVPVITCMTNDCCGVLMFVSATSWNDMAKTEEFLWPVIPKA